MNRRTVNTNEETELSIDSEGNQDRNRMNTDDNSQEFIQNEEQLEQLEQELNRIGVGDENKDEYADGHFDSLLNADGFGDVLLDDDESSGVESEVEDEEEEELEDDSIVEYASSFQSHSFLNTLTNNSQDHMNSSTEHELLAHLQELQQQLTDLRDLEDKVLQQQNSTNQSSAASSVSQPSPHLNRTMNELITEQQKVLEEYERSVREIKSTATSSPSPSQTSNSPQFNASSSSSKSTTIPNQSLHPSSSTNSITETPSSRTTSSPNTATRRLIVVSNRLPVTLNFSDDGTVTYSTSSGGLVSALAGVMKEMPFLWVGWTGAFVSTKESQEEIKSRLSDEFNNVPVFLTESVADLFYNGFCNDILWPLFHYVPLPVLNTQGERKFDPKFWTAYRVANSEFAKVITSIYQPGDLVWVQDYHLMMLPSLLRQAIPDIRTGFFLHTPFPSSDVFSVLPVASSLLRGVLEADLIGFHTYDYAHHFLSACSRLLGLECSHKGVDCSSGDSEVSEQLPHFSHVGIFPIGIDPSSFHKALETKAVQERVSELRENFHGRRILLGVDRLDYIKGVPHKIRAFERLLSRYPQWRDGSVVLIQIGVPSRVEVDEYKKLISQTNEMVAGINGRYGSVDMSPIVFINQSVSFHDLCALYSVADVCVVTSIRDGMNLVSSEFIVCQNINHGVLVLSEFAGSAHSLSGAIRVNPWNTDELANALNEALSLDQREREIRHWKLYRYVTTYTASYWAKSFVDELLHIADAMKQQAAVDALAGACHPLDLSRDVHEKLWKQQYTKERSGTTPAPGAPKKTEALGATSVGVVLSSPSKAVSGSAMSCVHGANHLRLFYFNYEETLHEAHTLSNLDEPGSRLRFRLGQLCADKRNRVYISSARPARVLERWFGMLSVGLIAENGSAFRHPSKSSWSRMHRGENSSSWFAQVMPILEYFTERTPGSLLEAKQFSITWHFQDANPQFGSWQAYELREHLSALCTSLGVDVISERKTLELKPTQISKVATMRRILSEIESNSLGSTMCCFMFALSGGNSREDEELFAMFRELSNPPIRNVVTCKVGKSSLAADRFVSSITAANTVLEELGTVMANVYNKKGVTQRNDRLKHRSASFAKLAG